MHYPASELVIDPVLIRKYDASGPRYTSYPTADRFVEAFGETQLRQWLAKRNIGCISQPLSLKNPARLVLIGMPSGFIEKIATLLSWAIWMAWFVTAKASRGSRPGMNSRPM